MAQAFRQLPRRVGSRPGQLRRAGEAFQESLQIQQGARAAARVQQQLKQIQARIQKMPATVERQRLQGTLQSLKQQLSTHHNNLHQWRSEARAESLQTHTTRPHPEEKAASLYFHKLYTEHHPLPRALREKYVAATPQQQNFKAFHKALEPLYVELILTEQNAWQGFWTLWDPPAPVPNTGAYPDTEPETEPETDDDFEVISFGEIPTIPRQKKRPAFAPSTDENLQVSFDFSRGKSTVRNAMGITLNQPKKTYPEYLQLGFQAMDQAVASAFEDRHLLEDAITHFLEAMSLDKSRHEAYFGLGYLYALVQDANHAMYFLDVAYKISGDPAIEALQNQVRSQLKL